MAWFGIWVRGTPYKQNRSELLLHLSFSGFALWFGGYWELGIVDDFLGEFGGVVADVEGFEVVVIGFDHPTTKTCLIVSDEVGVFG